MSGNWFYSDPRRLFSPYAFILKEGEQIKKNSLDYTLMMLDTALPERIPGKLPQKKNSPSRPSPALPPEVYHSLEDEF